jgi:molybdopterin-guanine dinucleotide biosynthesis protein A
MSNVTGIVLAGGSNTRFPLIKGLVKVGGERIIERTVRILREFCDEIIISTNCPENYFYLREKMVGDLYPMAGPAVGIFSALLHSSNDRNFVVACDMPFIKRELIQYIIDVQSDAPVVICSRRGYIDPLFGLYRKRLLPVLESHLQRGNTPLYRIIMSGETHIIHEEEILRLDAGMSSFVNINTPQDFENFIGGEICSD